MTPAVISAQKLTRRFGAVTAVNALNLEVHQGEIFGLVGPDGAGKSTALRMLCGLMKPTSGDATVAGYSITREKAALKKNIGYMPQRFSLYSDLSIAENLKFFASLQGVSARERDEFIPELLRMTALEPFQSRAAGKLSGGMKQKLALMCTLLHRPRVIVLDEPTNGLDPISRRDLWFLLYKLSKEGTTLLVSTTYMDEAARCHRVGVMDQGRLILCDSPDKLRTIGGEECYEVNGPDRQRLLASLKSCEGVISAERCGIALHLFIDPARTSAGKVLETLKAQAVEVSKLERIVPSLEDVFIATVNRTAAATV